MKHAKKTRHSPRFRVAAREAIKQLSRLGFGWGLLQFHNLVGDFIYQVCDKSDRFDVYNKLATRPVQASGKRKLGCFEHPSRKALSLIRILVIIILVII